MNDITGLNWKKISSFIGENIKTVKDRPYTREEVRKLLEAPQDRRLRSKDRKPRGAETAKPPTST